MLNFCRWKSLLNMNNYLLTNIKNWQIYIISYMYILTVINVDCFLGFLNRVSYQPRCTLVTYLRRNCKVHSLSDKLKYIVKSKSMYFFKICTMFMFLNKQEMSEKATVRGYLGFKYSMMLCRELWLKDWVFSLSDILPILRNPLYSDTAKQIIKPNDSFLFKFNYRIFAKRSGHGYYIFFNLKDNENKCAVM